MYALQCDVTSAKCIVYEIESGIVTVLSQLGDNDGDVGNGTRIDMYENEARLLSVWAKARRAFPD